MRKGFTGLESLILQHLGEDPLGGDIFVFINRRATNRGSSPATSIRAR
ncbi:hypothetical protein DYH09_28935 [bacterium CPR1]|nr:hypothetical protein [bacterium CPR1]